MKKIRLKKKNCAIALFILLFIIFELINPFRIIAKSKLKNLGYSSESSKKIIALGLKSTILNQEYNKFIDLNINDKSFNRDNIKYYIELDYDNKIDVDIINSLIQKEYSSSEINCIIKSGNIDDIKNLVNDAKVSDISKYLSFDYAKLANLKRYINYKSIHSADYEESVTNVNIGLDKEFYTDYTTVTNFSYTMLVNKYRKLENDFIPPELVSFPKEYCRGTCPTANKQVVEAFVKMAEALYEEEKLHVYVNSAYRSFGEQEETYNRLIKLYGPNYDVAKAGFSEHQTGLSIDLSSGSSDKYKGSKEQKWIDNNAYKYGFIKRYDSGKVSITGYNEPWHYRYVSDVAEEVQKSKLTFDEYYIKKLDK